MRPRFHCSVARKGGGREGGGLGVEEGEGNDTPMTVLAIHRSLRNHGRGGTGGRLIRPSPASWINLSGELMNES